MIEEPALALHEHVTLIARVGSTDRNEKSSPSASRTIARIFFLVLRRQRTLLDTGAVVRQQHPAAGDPCRPRRLLGDQEAAALFLKAPNTTLLYEMELAAEGLLCGLCSFRLTGQEEIEIAGLPPTARAWRP